MCEYGLFPKISILQKYIELTISCDICSGDAIYCQTSISHIIFDKAYLSLSYFFTEIIFCKLEVDSDNWSQNKTKKKKQQKRKYIKKSIICTSITSS